MDDTKSCLFEPNTLHFSKTEMSSLKEHVERFAKQLMDVKQGIEQTKELLEQTKRVHEDGMQLIKKHELEVEEEEAKAKNKKQKKEEDDDFILVVYLLPQTHDIDSDGDGGCQKYDMEIQVDCYKIPVSDLGKDGTPLASCEDIKDLRREWWQLGKEKERYRVYDDSTTYNTVLRLSRARYQVVFI